MDIKAKVHEIGQTVTVSDKFKKRELILEYAENPQYPEFIKFEAVQDKTTMFDNLKVGDNVELFFNLRGRPYTDKSGKTAYFNSLVAWKVNILAAGTGAAQPEYAKPVEATPEDDDLPF